MKLLKTISLTGLFLLASSGVVFAAQFNQGIVSWTTQPNARCYRIYYKETKAPLWQHSVGCKDLSATSFRYTIGYLKPNVSYTYSVVAVWFDDQEHWLGNHVMHVTPMRK